MVPITTAGYSDTPCARRQAWPPAGAGSARYQLYEAVTPADMARPGS